LSSFEDPIGSGKLDPTLAEMYTTKRAPVSIRNNNMGAISLGEKNSWVENLPGYIGKSKRPASEGGYYARFATPEAGVHAASELLRRYGRKGINTPYKIVKKWSTDSSAWTTYAETIADRLGVEINDEIDLENPVVRKLILMSMSAHESGTGRPIYHEEVFNTGVDPTFGLTPEYFAGLDIDQKLQTLEKIYG
jgi:hypothetical protein